MGWYYDYGEPRRASGGITCTYGSNAHFIPGSIGQVEVDCCIQGMDGDFLTSKDKRHVDLLVAWYFPDASDVGSIDVLRTGDTAVYSIGQGPKYLVSIAKLVLMGVPLLGDLTQGESGIKHCS